MSLMKALLYSASSAQVLKASVKNVFPRKQSWKKTKTKAKKQNKTQSTFHTL